MNGGGNKVQLGGCYFASYSSDEEPNGCAFLFLIRSNQLLCVSERADVGVPIDAYLPKPVSCSVRCIPPLRAV